MRALLFPLIKKYWKLLLATALIAAMGSAVMMGMGGSYRSLETTLYGYIDRYGYPDAVITTSVTDRGHLEALAEVPGVEIVSARLCADTVLQSPGGRYLSVRVFSYNDNDPMIFHFWSSADSDGANEVFIERSFAEDNGLRAGDTVRFRVGDEWRDFFIGGIVSLPETLAVQPTNDSWTVNTDFGYAYASVHLLEIEYNKVYSETLDELEDKSAELEGAREDADRELEDARQKLDDAGAELRDKEQLLADSSLEAEEKRAELERTKQNLESTRAALVSQREQLVSGRGTAQSGLAELRRQRESLNAAAAGLDTIDSQLTEVLQQRAALMSDSSVSAIELLRQVPPDTRLDVIAASVSSFEDLISSARAYGFYYDVNASVSGVAASLRSFLDGVTMDVAYLNSGDAQDVIWRVENGEEGIGDTPEYAALAAVVSRYAYVEDPAGMPAAYSQALTAAGDLLLAVDSLRLESAVSVLSGFDATRSAAAISSLIDSYVQAVGRLENALGASFSTVGEVVDAYDRAAEALASGQAALESARADIVSGLDAYGLTEADIPSSLADLDNSIRTLENTLAEIDAGLPQIDDGIAQIDEALPEIEAGLAEIDEKLAEARAQLEEARTELSEGEDTYRQTAADVLLEFASLEDELADAYDQLEDGQGYQDLCNQFLLWFAEDADPGETLAAAEAALGNVTVKSSVPFSRSGVGNRIELNLTPLATMSIFIPAVFFAVLLVIVFLFMSLIVRQCRREIGILRALGFSSGSIRGLFLMVILVTSLFASALTFALGWALTRYIALRYAAMFSVPVPVVITDWGRGALACVLLICVGQLSTLVSTRFVLTISPSEAMSRPAPSTARIPGPLEKLSRLAGPMTSFSITSLLRNRLRFVFTVFCVAASVMIIFSSLAFFSAQRRILAETYDERIRYDCQMFFSEPVDEATLAGLAALDFVRDVQSMPYYNAEISFGTRSRSAVINGLESDTALVGIFDRNGQPLSPPSDGGILLEATLADSLGAREGDIVLVNGTAALRVEGISSQSISRLQYLSLGGAKRLGDETIGSVICRVAQGDEQALLRYLSEQDNTLYTVFTRLSLAATEKQLQSFDYAAWIIICFSVFTGFVIVLNTARTNTLEKRRELCVLRTLGFQHTEVSRSWYSQSILQYLCACVLGFPAGRLLAVVAMGKISSDVRTYPYSNGPREYLLTAAIVLAYITVSHLAAMREFARWDLVENVKEKE